MILASAPVQIRFGALGTRFVLGRLFATGRLGLGLDNIEFGFFFKGRAIHE